MSDTNNKPVNVTIENKIPKQGSIFPFVIGAIVGTVGTILATNPGARSKVKTATDEISNIITGKKKEMQTPGNPISSTNDE